MFLSQYSITPYNRIKNKASGVQIFVQTQPKMTSYTRLKINLVTLFLHWQ